MTDSPILVERTLLPEPAERKAIRLRAGVGQAELARALEVSVYTLWSWERGKTTPLGRNLRLYGQALQEMRELDRSAGSGPATR